MKVLDAEFVKGFMRMADDGWLQEFQENGVGDLLAQIRQKRGRL